MGFSPAGEKDDDTACDICGARTRTEKRRVARGAHLDFVTINVKVTLTPVPVGPHTPHCCRECAARLNRACDDLVAGLRKFHGRGPMEWKKVW